MENKMKIVGLGMDFVNPGDLDWNILTEGFDDFTLHPVTERDRIAEWVKDADAVIASMEYVKEILPSARKLKYFGVLSTGYDAVDLDYCRAHGITVTNVPKYSGSMVSQYAISLLLEICTQVGHHSSLVKSGEWARSGKMMLWDRPILELAGKTMGIIGLGDIGRRTARTAQALGMDVLYSDRFRIEEAENEHCHFSSLDELYSRSDVIVLHCPLFESNRGMINSSSIAKMKDGVIIINNARGALVNEEDLASALHSGKVYAAGLDVSIEEPMREDNPLMKEENCFITAHISWVARECRARALKIARENLVSFISGKPINVVG